VILGPGEHDGGKRVCGSCVHFEELARLATLEELGAATTAVPPTLCVTPCWIGMPYGKHSLRLTLRSDDRRSDLVRVPFREDDFIYRRALGRHDPNLHGRRVHGLILVLIGGNLFVSGVVFSIASTSRRRSRPGPDSAVTRRTRAWHAGGP
jgi:hypothetical protein